jgi:hypothetical protein
VVDASGGSGGGGGGFGGKQGGKGGGGGKGKRDRSGADDGEMGGGNEDTNAYTKSAAFFSKLQRTAQEEIGGIKRKDSKAKKLSGAGDKKAASFKL